MLRRALVAALSVTSVCMLASVAGAQETSSTASAPGGAALVDADPDDPAVLRLKLLARMDAQIDETAWRAHLAARLLLEDVLPIPYLGVDADPFDDGRPGMLVKVVYEDTCAEAAGLRAGDVLLALGDDATTSKATLGKAIRLRGAGTPVELHVVRDGQPLVLRGALGTRPAEDEDEEEQFPELFGPAPTPPRPLAFDFEGAHALPPEFESVLAGTGAMPDWRIVSDADGTHLRQASQDRTSIRFPMALVREGVWSDAVASVRFRLVSGVVDRAAGIVMRYRDPGNYLVARANAGEGDLRLFRVVDGVRRTLPGAIGLHTFDDGWHTLELRAEGAEIRASLDGGEPVVSYDTYLRRGRIGLWTKADAVTDFDDFEVRLPGE
ncbi:MAG: PDZ domain-containing protein [Planctomycetes bacterium]|nr:PDZ domain-containing protein [Planctomycetota bacterium]